MVVVPVSAITVSQLAVTRLIIITVMNVNLVDNKRLKEGKKAGCSQNRIIIGN